MWSSSPSFLPAIFLIDVWIESTATYIDRFTWSRIQVHKFVEIKAERNTFLQTLSSTPWNLVAVTEFRTQNLLTWSLTGMYFYVKSLIPGGSKGNIGDHRAGSSGVEVEAGQNHCASRERCGGLIPVPTGNNILGLQPRREPAPTVDAKR